MEERVELRRVDDWPELLVGPMLRTVTRDEAHIFIATKSPCRATVLVEHGVATTSDLPNSSDAGVQLRPIGAKLHVGLLRVALPDPTPDRLYSYDIQLTMDHGAVWRLDDLGLLGNDPAPGVDPEPIQRHVPLGYTIGILPNFLTPPDDVAQLRLAHCSCRKPHGNEDDALEPDALPILDEIIARAQFERLAESADATYAWMDANGNPTPAPEYPPLYLAERPHQLVMTGDQIYADDVSPALLDALSDAAEKLMGWDEYVPGIAAGLNGFLIEPGWRTRYLTIAGLKEMVEIGAHDYPQSHLLRFGEWCAMYLMAWSPALWPRTTDGTKVRLRNADQRLPVAKAVELLDTYESIPGARVPPWMTQVGLVLKLGKRLEKFEANRVATWKRYQDPAEQFGSTVAYVRRVLANTPTYTMFDDHEITDDWYVDRSVADRLLGRDPLQSGWTAEVGPRILRNGLSAYAIFQHWGNAPEDFADWDDPTQESTTSGSVGQRLLTMWKPPTPFHRPPLGGDEQDFSLVTHLIANDPWWLHLQELVDGDGAPTPVDFAQIRTQWQFVDFPVDLQTHAADEILRIADYLTDDAGNFPGSGDPAARATFGKFRWDYAREFDSHRLIALDTRTWRRFPTAVAALPLLGSLTETDVIAARNATAPVLATDASVWMSSNDLATRLFGELLYTSTTLLNAWGAGLDTMMAEFASALDAFTDLVAIDLDALVNVQQAIADFNAELDGTATCDARLDLDSDLRKYNRVGALAREVADLFDYTAQGPAPASIVGSLSALAGWFESVLSGSSRAALSALLTLVNDSADMVLRGDAIFAATPAENAEIQASRLVAVTALGSAIAAHEIHDRSNAFFRDGTGYLAAELISEPALDWMVTVPLAQIAPGKETVILSPAPMFADDVVDVIQRGLVAYATRHGQAGAEEWEFESWSANPVGFDNLVAAARGLDHAVVLSGDVHYAYSNVSHVVLPMEAVDTTYIQLVSSAAKNSDAITKRIGLAGDFLWDNDGRFKLHQFSPIALARSWDLFEAPPGTPSAQPGAGGSGGPSFVGWLGEYLQQTLADTARKYWLDDLALMIKELRAIDSVEDIIHWKCRWFWRPALEGIWNAAVDLGQNAPQYAQASFDYITQAPVNTFAAWIHESLWMNLSFFTDLEELALDPTRKVFGHSLYSRDVLLEQVADAYKALGVDPAYGFTIDKRNLRDTRVDRMLQYGARNRFAHEPRNTFLYGHVQETQVVGNSNIGLVRFLNAGDRLGIRHDILFYPVPSHPGIVVPQPGPWSPNTPDPPDAGEVAAYPYPRTDWIATQHTGWFDPAFVVPPEEDSR